MARAFILPGDIAPPSTLPVSMHMPMLAVDNSAKQSCSSITSSSVRSLLRIYSISAAPTQFEKNGGG